MMEALKQLASEFVTLWIALREVFGEAFALKDPALQAARRNYLQEKLCA